jgi:alpha-mannosidase
VQPDSLIPAGETHVRNLLEGRRVAQPFGRPSSVAYTPDSFGHPAQLPQIFAGFGLDPFVYWRGHGNEIEDLRAEWIWRAPDGSDVGACHLSKGYFGAWGLSDDVNASVARLENLARDLSEKSDRDCVLLLNGIDHQPPDSNTREIAEALAKKTGWDVERGLLDRYAEGLRAAELAAAGAGAPRFAGELVGARVAPLLPGVWSTHIDLKLWNRRCETLLTGWVEPFCEIARWQGGPDERPSVRAAWRALIPNQAHDSICGCSQDRVHEHMKTRYDETFDLGEETLQRLLERTAGLGVERQIEVDPDTGDIGIAVFNPSPHPRTDRVRLPLDGFPAFTSRGIAPLLALNFDLEGIEVDGRPARILRDKGTVRPQLTQTSAVHEIEFVAEDVPAFGFKRMRLARSAAHPATKDRRRTIENGHVKVHARADGTFDVSWGEARFSGLCDVIDRGDRGDTYDFDPVDKPNGSDTLTLEENRVKRRRHASGIDRLVIDRVYRLPESLASNRKKRSKRMAPVRLKITATIMPGSPRVDLDVELDNRARDHRLQLCFPTGAPAAECTARTTFDVVTRSTTRPDDSDWVQAAPDTFPQQGFVAANGLQVTAPGLVEAGVSSEGTIAFTLVRSVGWLSRSDLRTRPMEAGPTLATPHAQCLGHIRTRLSLSPGVDPGAALDAELGLRAVATGHARSDAMDRSLLEIDEPRVEVSSFKPAEDGRGSVLRLLNVTSESLRATVRLGGLLASRIRHAERVRLDETSLGEAVRIEAGAMTLEIGAHAMVSLRLTGEPR